MRASVTLIALGLVLIAQSAGALPGIAPLPHWRGVPLNAGFGMVSLGFVIGGARGPASYRGALLLALLGTAALLASVLTPMTIGGPGRRPVVTRAEIELLLGAGCSIAALLIGARRVRTSHMGA